MSLDSDERRERVLAALVEAGAAGLSGQALADELTCSRAAIHRHVETLRRRGVAVDGTHEGYRLAPGADPIAARLIETRLVAPIAGPVRWAKTTESTNDDAVAEARGGAPEGLVIGADFQSKGRGRRGREWRSNPGDGLLFSVLLRPPVSTAEVGMVPILAAVAVAEALGEGAGIIWPNDVVIDGRKVCGILCELAADEAGVGWIVVGIGINVRGAPALGDARWRPGALTDGGAALSRAEVLIAVLARLGEHYARWLVAGPGEALAAYTERDLLADREVTVQAGNRETTGPAQGLDAGGRLLVGGVALGAGEVTRVSAA